MAPSQPPRDKRQLGYIDVPDLEKGSGMDTKRLFGYIQLPSEGQAATESYLVACEATPPLTPSPKGSFLGAQPMYQPAMGLRLSVPTSAGLSQSALPQPPNDLRNRILSTVPKDAVVTDDQGQWPTPDGLGGYHHHIGHPMRRVLSSQGASFQGYSLHPLSCSSSSQGFSQPMSCSSSSQGFSQPMSRSSSARQRHLPLPRPMSDPHPANRISAGGVNQLACPQTIRKGNHGGGSGSSPLVGVPPFTERSASEEKAFRAEVRKSRKRCIRQSQALMAVPLPPTPLGPMLPEATLPLVLPSQPVQNNAPMATSFPHVLTWMEGILPTAGALSNEELQMNTGAFPCHTGAAQQDGFVHPAFLSTNLAMPNDYDIDAMLPMEANGLMDPAFFPSINGASPNLDYMGTMQANGLMAPDLPYMHQGELSNLGALQPDGGGMGMENPGDSMAGPTFAEMVNQYLANGSNPPNPAANQQHPGSGGSPSGWKFFG